MFIGYVVIAVLFALALVMSGVGKLTKQERIVTTITGLGVPLSWFPWLATVLIAGGLGLVIGIWVPAIGVAAGIGVFLYFAGAVITHLRAREMTLGPPLVL